MFHATQNRDLAVVAPSFRAAIAKLAGLGERAGFSVDQLIEFLNDGLSVATIMDLIALRMAAMKMLEKQHGTTC